MHVIIEIVYECKIHNNKFPAYQYGLAYSTQRDVNFTTFDTGLISKITGELIKPWLLYSIQREYGYIPSYY